MFDVDKFIQCIHEKPALWEKKLKEYSDKNCREKSWLEIGEVMYNDWLELDLEQRDTKVKEMKGKWRHIRDNFSKFLNRGKSGDTAPKTKKYIYADALSFLINTMEKRKTCGIIAESVDEDDKNGEDKNYGCEEDFDKSSSEPGPSNKEFKAPLRQNRAHGLKMTPFQNLLIKKLDESSKDEEDADKYFLLSLLPDYKKLSDQEKTQFKLLAIQFFDRIQRKHNTSHRPSNQMDYSQNFPISTMNLAYHTQNSAIPMQMFYPPMYNVQQPMFSPSPSTASNSSSPSTLTFSQTPVPSPSFSSNFIQNELTLSKNISAPVHKDMGHSIPSGPP